MKRVECALSFILSLILCFSLCSCNNSTNTADTDSTSNDQTDVSTYAPAATPSLEGKDVLFQIPGKFDVSMGYVIRTSDNKTIVIDGGEANADGYNDVRDDFMNVVRSVTGDMTPTIDAWFFSHCHRDHIGVFNELMAENSPALIVKNVYYNFPSKEYIRSDTSDMSTYNNFMSALEKCENVVTVQQGDIIQIGSVSFEVMLTPDESVTSNRINESSVVYRATISQQSVLFLGDLGRAGGLRLYHLYRNKLQSDVVQMAHHGSNGVTDEIYRVFAPKVCLWPDAAFIWDEDRNDAGEFSTIKTYDFLNELNKDIKHYIASQEGLLMLEFPLDI